MALTPILYLFRALGGINGTHKNDQGLAVHFETIETCYYILLGCEEVRKHESVVR